MGLRLDNLGTGALTWRDLLVVVRHSPRTSALTREIGGEAAAWTVTDHLLAATVDALNAANWQRGGGKGRKPKPVKRPGSKSETATFGKGAIPIQDFDDWWGGEHG